MSLPEPPPSHAGKAGDEAAGEVTSPAALAEPARAVTPRAAVARSPTAEELARGEREGPDGGPRRTARPRHAAGTRIARFVVLDFIGAGGMGELYKAYDGELDRAVALKLVRAQGVRNVPEATARERLLREAKALARLSHPNVVAVYEAGTFENEVYIAMEFLDGVSLRKWLKEEPRSRREILAAFFAAGEGLAAAHQADLVHRDFKPDNVFVTSAGRIKVIDFGLARSADEGRRDTDGSDPSGSSSRDGSRSTRGERKRQLSSHRSERLEALTEAGTLVGTPLYMAPEQHLGHEVTAASDQFSFCVALYEALYERRPFSGETRHALKVQAVMGQVEPAPPGSNVPRWLRKVLLRGLSTVPSDRFETMDDLLAALQADPGLARRRWIRWGAVALAAAGIAGGLVHAQRKRSAVCEGGEARLAGVWDDEARRAVHQAFRKTALPYAEDAFRGVELVLDEYTRAWSAMRGEACRATRVRGEQSEELMDLRMACLDDRLDEVRTEVAVFRNADARVVERAMQAAQGLTSLDGCADGRRLRFSGRRPTEPSVRARVDDLRRRLLETRARLSTGTLGPDAVAVADALANEARSIGHRPSEAAALELVAASCDATGHYRRAAEAARGAILAAEAAGDDELVVRGWSWLAWTQGERLGKLDEGLELMEHAHAALERLGTNDVLLADLLDRESRMLARRGQLELAYDRAKRSLSLRENGTPRDIVLSGMRLADVSVNLHRLDEALALYDRMLALVEREYGPAHPWVGVVLNNRGMCQQRLFRLDEARLSAVRARLLAEATVGPDHPSVAVALVNEAHVLKVLGRPVEALPLLERCLRIAEPARGASHPDVAEIRAELGDVLLSLGRVDEASAMLKTSLDVWEKSLGPQHPDLAGALVPLGDLLQRSGDTKEALRLLERAEPLVRGPSVDPWLPGRALFLLGRTLAATGGDRARAAQLVEEATAFYRKLGATGDAGLAAAAAWLREHGPSSAPTMSAPTTSAASAPSAAPAVAPALPGAGGGAAHASGRAAPAIVAP